MINTTHPSRLLLKPVEIKPGDIANTGIRHGPFRTFQNGGKAKHFA